MPGTCKPRFATPLPDVPNRLDEFRAVAKRLRRELMPWQEHAAALSSSYDPDSGEQLFDEVVVTIPRQGGKSTLVVVKTVRRLVVVSRRLGPQRSTYTAQDRASARRKLERDFAEVLRRAQGLREMPHARSRPVKPTDWRLTLNNGSEAIQFGGGSWWQIETPSETGGHGDTLDDGTIDEAFSHEDDAVEGGMRPAMITRPDKQLWVISTAGDRKSKYLYRKVLAGRRACETGEHGRTAYIEYSADPDADPGDPATWWSCNPALGFTQRESDIASEWDIAKRKGPDGIRTFIRAYTNGWPDAPALDDEEAEGWELITAEVFALGVRPDSRPRGELTHALEVDVDANGVEWASIGVSDGEWWDIVTPPGAGPGTGWVVDAAKANRDRLGELLVDERGPARHLIDPLERAGVRVRRVSGAEVVSAHMGGVAAMQAGRVVHLGQPRLSEACRLAVSRTAGDGAWVISRSRSHGDVGPFLACLLARHGALSGAERRWSGPLVAVT